MELVISSKRNHRNHANMSIPKNKLLKRNQGGKLTISKRTGRQKHNISETVGYNIDSSKREIYSYECLHPTIRNLQNKKKKSNNATKS
jgi:hypothetical protein